ADRADNHLAGIDTDSDLHQRTAARADLLSVAVHSLLHAHGGIARAGGVILLGQRRAKERHYPVAHDLVHGACVAVNRLDHVLEHALKDVACVLQIARRQQLHRSLDVREKDRDLLALVLERSRRAEEGLGEASAATPAERRAVVVRHLAPGTLQRWASRVADRSDAPRVAGWSMGVKSRAARSV